MTHGLRDRTSGPRRLLTHTVGRPVLRPRPRLGRLSVAWVRGLRGLRGLRGRAEGPRPIAASRRRRCPDCQESPSLGDSWRPRLGCASWRSSASVLPKCCSDQCHESGISYVGTTCQAMPRSPRIPLAPSLLPRLLCECKGRRRPQDAS